MITRFKVGDKVMMTNDALENYGFKYEGKKFTVSHVATNTSEHPGYDNGVKGQALYDLKELGFSLYDWEVYSA